MGAGSGGARIANAQVEGAFSEEVRKASGYDAHYSYGGSFTIGDVVSDNLIPIPLSITADVELVLESCGEIVRIRGTNCCLELLGEAEYIEDFQP
jgi:hypothetical protein